MGRQLKEESDRKTEHLLIRLQKELKKIFAQKCYEEMVDMSVKARQLIAKEVNYINK